MSREWPQATYERFVRASITRLCNALWKIYGCVRVTRIGTAFAEDPDYAPAWAWLGRCCWFFEKFTDSPAANSDLTHSVFQRAFALDPDLAAAHQFYTHTWCRWIWARRSRTSRPCWTAVVAQESHPDEPESLAGLVQAFRFRGLLKRSIEMHRRAAEVDPTVVTSVAHTLFLAGEYGDAIQAYGGRAAYYLDAASWAALGDLERAATLLQAYG